MNYNLAIELEEAVTILKLEEPLVGRRRNWPLLSEGTYIKLHTHNRWYKLNKTGGSLTKVRGKISKEYLDIKLEETFRIV